ncbi:hypothetical protein [Variovorax sp. E3]|uniref:hypothetical protein n=1 Tax=Variovorax sp. E3 TaxID=1914993 RepID=UPI0018DE7E6F|nr:hypothetical protein [Variovorax sp. E3]
MQSAKSACLEGSYRPCAIGSKVSGEISIGICEHPEIASSPTAEAQIPKRNFILFSLLFVGRKHSEGLVALAFIDHDRKARVQAFRGSALEKRMPEPRGRRHPLFLRLLKPVDAVYLDAVTPVA